MSGAIGIGKESRENSDKKTTEQHPLIPKWMLTIRNKITYLELRRNLVLARPGEAIIFVQNHGPDIHLPKALIVVKSTR